jgi:transcriptional regulator with XRE-family HTH domain
MKPALCRAARALVGWSQEELARRSGLSSQTVIDFELQRRVVAPESIAKMQRALEKAGVELTNGKRPGVRLKA